MRYITPIKLDMTSSSTDPKKIKPKLKEQNAEISNPNEKSSINFVIGSTRFLF